MKSIRNYSFLFILIFFSCCQENVKTKLIETQKSNYENQKENTQHKKVIIHGTSDDSLALKYFNLMNHAYLFASDYKNTKRNIHMDSIYIEVDSIFKPQSFEVAIFGDSSSYYRTQIFLEPGDTISFKIKDKKLHFNGKNAAYSNFFIALEKNTTQYHNNPYKGNIQDYKKRVKDMYDQRKLFFDQYSNKITSTEQIDLINDILKFEYLNNLIQPRSVKSRDFNLYYNTQIGVLATIEEEYSKREDLFDIISYVDNVTIDDFNRSDLLANSFFFKEALNSYIRFYFVNNDYLKYTQESFLAEKEFIQKNFDGDLENYAIARMIREYNVNGFGYSEINIALMKGLIDDYKDQFTQPSYKEKMDEFKEELDNFNFKLPKDALHSKLINPMGDTTTLSEVFNRTTQKIKVIDFWATWCPPCIIEIKKAKDFKNKLKDRDNVEWIYISVDKEHDKWLKKTLELQEFFNVKNQYYLVGGKNSSLGKSLKVNGIPRYVIFDKQEKIILDNAPKPSNSIVFKRVIDEINLNKE